MNSQLTKPYSPASGPSGGQGLGYLDTLPSQSGDLRYNQEPTLPQLPVEQPQTQYTLGLYSQPELHSGPQYPQDPAPSYYQPGSALCDPAETRPRFGHSSIPTGIDHTPRTATLPHPGPLQGSLISVRDQYSRAPPSFRRTSEHTSRRSPSSLGVPHRHSHMLTRPSLVPGFSNPLDRMDGSYGQQPSSSEGIPPLAEIKTVGALHYTDQAKTPADVGINGSIDKGFFLADNEWTCYRRNYFSCVCSYTLTPYMSGIPIELTMPGTHPVPVCGFAMGISAVVAENDTHSIGLVQHTPKRDKGPIKIPSRVPLMAKQDGAPRSMAYFNNGQPGAGETIYPDGWVPANTEGPNPGTLTEWTFERVQFKQATQNNGKRRAAQQYYQLMIELYANTGTPANPNFVKIAYRKSSKMIVRGRSPGHYQNERRGSSVHPPPSGTPSQSYGVMGGVRDFNSGQLMQPYGYDSHASVYGTARHTHHTLPAEALIPPEDEKAIESTKAYQYYPGSIYPSHDNRIDMWSHNDASPESMAAPHTLSTPLDMNDKVKDEYETAGATAHTNAGGASGSTTTNNASSSSSPLPRLMQPQTLGGTDHPRSCRPFDGKPTSTGYYPHHHMTPPTMGVGVTMQ